MPLLFPYIFFHAVYFGWLDQLTRGHQLNEVS
jgi:hypothetical protein